MTAKTFDVYFSMCRLNVTNLTEQSIPVEQTNKEVMNQLKQKIESGEYTLGELIVPQMFEKTYLKDGKLHTEEIMVQGRKITLDEIRSNINKEQKVFMRIMEDDELAQLTEPQLKQILFKIGEYEDGMSQDKMRETLKKLQRTRHLMFWHDGSTVSNHGHLLMMVAVMYDPAVFYTDDEYKAKYGDNINVQATIEKPHFYLLARCPSSDQQIMYSDTRMEDIIIKKEH